MHEVGQERCLPPPPAASLAKLVMQVQRLRRLALYATATAAVILTLSYLLLIWPIFQPHDLSNSSVQQFLLSQDFKTRTASLFKQLERYNAHSSASSVERPDDFYASSGSMSGLVVVVHYRLVARGYGAADGARATYVPYIDVRLDQRYLIIYLALMAIFVLLSHSIWRPAPEAQRRFEQRLLEHAYADLPPAAGDEGEQNDRLEPLLNLLEQFHVFARQIGVRHAARSTLTFTDEYDVQDALHALLKLHYPCVRAEEYTPSYAGNSSRMDFLLDDQAIAIEVKMTRAGLRDREIVDQLLIDAARYRSHHAVTHLVCLVYDPAGLLSNPELLKKDLESAGLSIVIAPRF